MSVPNIAPSSVVFPDGTVIYTKSITSLQLSTATINVGLGGVLNAYSFTFGNVTTALIAFAQIGKQLNIAASNQVLLQNNSSLVWSSILPATNAVDTPYNGNITGTGFVGSGINKIKADDGLGDVFVASSITGFNITSDTNINLFFTGLPIAPAGTYTIYYSTDGGTTWTTTGLTLTVS